MNAADLASQVTFLFEVCALIVVPHYVSKRIAPTTAPRRFVRYAVAYLAGWTAYVPVYLALVIAMQAILASNPHLLDVSAVMYLAYTIAHWILLLAGPALGVRWANSDLAKAGKFPK